MLLIKANSELKNVFQRLIKTMKLQVEWNDVFVVMNNILILAGDVRSLIFNFDNKRIYTTIIEIPTESARLEAIPNDTLLNNAMNMTLYSFGKWGTITGLKVDKDYQTLNTLFSQILRPVNIEPGFGENNFRFFKNGVQITYEDTMIAILRLLKSEGKLNDRQSLVTSELKNDEKETPDKTSDKDRASDKYNESKHSDGLDIDDYENDYEIGLWHNLSWKKETCEFKKVPKSDADSGKSRIGNNFYITNYLCPKCEARLYMGVYPEDKELLIDTQEGRVFMARTYACHECNTFYTPCPQKLLQEGDIYILKFDDDRVAYEDYLDILGTAARRTTNYKFNEFESERNARLREEQGLNSDSNSNVNSDGEINNTAPVSKIKNLKDQLFKKSKDKNASSKNEPSENLNNEGSNKGSLNKDGSNKGFSSKIVPRLFSKNKKAPTWETDKSDLHNSDTANAEVSDIHDPMKEEAPGRQTHNALTSDSKPPVSDTKYTTQQLSGKTTDELKIILSDLEHKKAAAQSEQNKGSVDNNYLQEVREILQNKLTAKYDARMGVLNNLPPRQLSDLKNQIEKEQNLPENKKKEYIKEIDSHLFKAESKELAQKVELSKKKSYTEIEQIIKDVENRSLPEELKQKTLRQLRELKSARAKLEAEHIINHMPLHMDRKQLSTYIDKLNQYEEVDLTPYRAQLDRRMDMAEKEEISAMIKRGGKKDRAALWNLYEQLQAKDFKEENKAPFLEKIYDKVRKMDEDAIEKICPSIVTLSFADGLSAYEQISQGMFLPELKTNTLEMIQRRLTKLKTDESVQLMRKLKNDMEEQMTDCNGFYFYNAREELKISANEQNRKRMYDNAEDSDDIDNEEDEKHTAMLRAVNGYASDRGPYEYPLMVCDTSRSKNGKEGFVLTPDNIFYHTFLNSGKTNILNIDKIQFSKRLFSKGIYIKQQGFRKIKLPNNVKPEDIDAFTKILDDFATYLKEKPESRNIEYMAKEKHDVIHCYRCGFVYKNGSVCPKCGSKMNR